MLIWIQLLIPMQIQIRIRMQGAKLMRIHGDLNPDQDPGQTFKSQKVMSMLGKAVTAWKGLTSVCKGPESAIKECSILGTILMWPWLHLRVYRLLKTWIFRICSYSIIILCPPALPYRLKALKNMKKPNLPTFTVLLCLPAEPKMLRALKKMNRWRSGSALT
jgi:hypothetical protein